MIRILVLTVFAAIVLAGCEHNTQLTSGKEYLSRYGGTESLANANEKSRTISIAELAIEAANNEPILDFPARIGLARVKASEWGHHLTLTGIPGDEASSWKKLQYKLGAGYGEIVPIGPMIAAVSQRVDQKTDTIAEIRIAAARQHLDAVLIYQAETVAEERGNALAAANITVIGGFFLPNTVTEAEGVGLAILIDPITGYPYGTAQALVEKEDVVTSSWGWGEGLQARLVERARSRVVSGLVDEVFEMIKDLRLELAEKQAAS